MILCDVVKNVLAFETPIGEVDKLKTNWKTDEGLYIRGVLFTVRSWKKGMHCMSY